MEWGEGSGERRGQAWHVHTHIIRCVNIEVPRRSQDFFHSKCIANCRSIPERRRSGLGGLLLSATAGCRVYSWFAITSFLTRLYAPCFLPQSAEGHCVPHCSGGCCYRQCLARYLGAIRIGIILPDPTGGRQNRHRGLDHVADPHGISAAIDPGLLAWSSWRWRWAHRGSRCCRPGDPKVRVPVGDPGVLSRSRFPRVACGALGEGTRGSVMSSVIKKEKPV
jgi:hypothetical protein